MPETQTPPAADVGGKQPDTCTFCVPEFPAELKAEMKSRAAAQRMPLREWLVKQLRSVVKRKISSTK